MPTAELIVAADTVHTLDDRRPSAEAVALADGVIVAVGERRDVGDWRGPGTEVIDLGSATITPGLVDGHLHPVAGIGPTRGVDLSAVTSLPQLVGVLRQTPTVEPGGWVLGWGLNPNAFGSSPLTYAPLVEARGEAPVFLLMFDGHAALVSPAALRAAGVDGPQELPGGARIVVDGEGHPTGHLLEIPAYELVAAVLPAESADVRRDRFRRLLTEMAAVGLTAGHVMDFEGDSEELVTTLAEEMVLPLRLRFAPLCLPEVDAAALDRLIDQQRLGGRRWQVEGVKFMIDGTVDGGTAWLDAPDSLGECTTALWSDLGAYVDSVRRLAAAGVPTATHAIGDAAVRFVLDTLADLPAGPTRVPHRIEHLETVPDDLLGRFAGQDVTASLQPTHGTLYCRADQTDNWSRRLGPDRAGRGWRTRDLRAAGARVVLGSDWPVAPYDPRGILADAQLRRPYGQPETPPIGPGQALTALMALEGYTTHAAAAAGLGGQAGRIRVGGRADLTAFGLDPLTVPPDELAESAIPLTVVAGCVTHRR
jgi:predicted amidohydrolase YtcJ